jgi:hypothetical protein
MQCPFVGVEQRSFGVSHLRDSTSGVSRLAAWQRCLPRGARPKIRATSARARTDWLESDLEKYFIANWEDIDFGEEGPLSLVASQVAVSRLPLEKVDLLAKTAAGRWVAIELKIDVADGRDLTQLQSYMHNLAFALKIADEDVHGYLIARGFQEKVLYAATGNPRIKLLEFLVEN